MREGTPKGSDGSSTKWQSTTGRAACCQVGAVCLPSNNDRPFYLLETTPHHLRPGEVGSPPWWVGHLAQPQLTLLRQMRMLRCRELPWPIGMSTPHFCVAFLTERSRYRQSNGSQLRHLPRSHLWCRSSRTLRSPLWRRLYHRSVSVCYPRRISFPSSLLQAEHPLCSGSTPPLTSTRHHVPRKTSRVQYFKTRILLQSYMQPLPRTPLRRHFRQ